MGQRLALKHLLVDPKEKEREEAARAKAEAEAIKAAAAAAEDCSSEAESEWTWETCSESEAEELEEDKPAKKAEPAPVVKPVCKILFEIVSIEKLVKIQNVVTFDDISNPIERNFLLDR